MTATIEFKHTKLVDKSEFWSGQTEPPGIEFDIYPRAENGKKYFQVIWCTDTKTGGQALEADLPTVMAWCEGFAQNLPLYEQEMSLHP